MAKAKAAGGGRKTSGGRKAAGGGKGSTRRTAKAGASRPAASRKRSAKK